MSSYKTFSNYQDAKAFYDSLTNDRMPELGFDPEFGMYEIMYWN